MCSKKWIFLTKVSSQRGRYHEKANVSKTKPDNFVTMCSSHTCCLGTEFPGVWGSGCSPTRA